MLASLFLFLENLAQVVAFVGDLISLTAMQNVLGLDPNFANVLSEVVQVLFDFIEKGIDFVIDLVLSIPNAEQFFAAFRSQFAGCCISVIFLVSSHMYVCRPEIIVYDL